MKKYLLLLPLIFFAEQVVAAEKIYVGAKGRDTGNGTIENPYAAFEDAVEKFKRTKASDVEIVVLPGTYYLDRGVYISGADTKGRKLSIVGVSDKNGRRPVLTGAAKIPSSEFKPVSDKSVLALIPQEAEGKLHVANLKKLGITDYGEVKQRGFGGKDPALEMELFFNLKPMRPAQYPNDLSLLPIGEVLDRGTVYKNASGIMGPKPPKDDNIRGATFKYDYGRADRWVSAPDAFVRGNLSVGWAYDQIKIKKVDKSAKTITLQSPHIYGVYSNTPPKNPKWIDIADLKVRGYQVFNLIEELDCPDEYYIDRANGLCYILLAPGKKPSGDYRVSTQTNPLINMKRADGVSIRNIDFAASRGHPVYADSCRQITIDGCDFYGLGRPLVITGVSYKPQSESASDHYSKNNKIVNCKIHDNALGGAVLNGGNKRLLLSSESSVENCEFYNNALRKPIVTPTLNIGGVGTRVSNCYFHDHPHQTLLHTGNNLVIERNVFVNCCQNASDMGVIYTYSNYAQLGNVVRYNFFSDNLANKGDFSSAVAGVYVDESAAGMLVEKNIFCRTGSMGGAPAFGAIYIHGGCETRAKQNVFIECESAFGCQTWADDRYEAVINSEAQWRKTHIDVEKGVYPETYPNLSRILDPKAPRINYAEENKVYNTSMAMNGDLFLRYNKNLRPNKGVNPADLLSVKKWTLEDVKKYFGEDPLVKNILSVPMGLKK